MNGFAALQYQQDFSTILVNINLLEKLYDESNNQKNHGVGIDWECELLQ
jgi:hypothetical protein